MIIIHVLLLHTCFLVAIYYFVTWLIHFSIVESVILEISNQSFQFTTYALTTAYAFGLTSVISSHFDKEDELSTNGNIENKLVSCLID